MHASVSLVSIFTAARMVAENAPDDATTTQTGGGDGAGQSVGWGTPTTVAAQKFSWTTGEDKAPVVETKRLEDVHGVRVGTALHTLATVGSLKHQRILAGGSKSPPYPTVREIARDLNIV